MTRSRRRTFLTQLASAGTVALAPGLGCAREQQGRPADRHRTGPPSRARVVLVQSAAAVSESGGHAESQTAVQRMLDRGLRELARSKDARRALAGWVRTVDTVGLKVNCLAGRQMSTHLELVEALIALLEQIGLPRRQAIVFDRADVDLRRAGYPLRSSGSDYRCVGNDRAGYERELRVMKSGASLFSRVATHQASVLINMPILKDHGLAGLSGALKNNFGLINNPNKFHLNGCDPHVAEVNAFDFVRNKQRLIICDALRVQADGGPAFHPAAAVTFGGLLLSTDPVALDLIAWEILDNLREQRKLPSLAQDKRAPLHLATAAKSGLGVGDRKKIDLVKIKVS